MAQGFVLGPPSVEYHNEWVCFQEEVNHSPRHKPGFIPFLDTVIIFHIMHKRGMTVCIDYLLDDIYELMKKKNSLS